MPEIPHAFPVGNWGNTPPWPRTCDKCGLREDQIASQMDGCKGRKMPDIPYVEDVTRFWLPVAPTTNNLYENTGRGRRKSPGYRSWLTEAGWRIKEQRVQPIPGKRWALRIEAPVDHRRDLSNCLKATEDLIVEMQLISDDRYIDHIVLERTEVWRTLCKDMRVSIWALS